jgi:hypothetical protein
MATITPHPDYARMVETLGGQFATTGRTVSAHDFALIIRESRENGVDTDIYRDAAGSYLELHDSRGRTYGRYRQTV